MMQGEESWTLSDLMGVHTYVPVSIPVFVYKTSVSPKTNAVSLTRKDSKCFIGEIYKT